MSKLQRLVHKIFGSAADLTTEFVQFGSLKNNSPTFATTTADIQALANYEGGLGEALIGNNSPAKEDLNSLLHLMSRQTGYLFQEGIPEYDTSTTYYINGFVKHNGVLYKCLQDNTLNKNPSTESTYWFSEENSMTGLILPFGGSVIPDGFLLCDGSAVSRTSYSRLFSVIGTTWGNGDTSTTFNIPDMRERVPVRVGTKGSGVTAHDTYTLGEFKDDQTQGHTHARSGNFLGARDGANGGAAFTADSSTYETYQMRTDGTNGTPRVGAVTRGKRSGVNYIIKY